MTASVPATVVVVDTDVFSHVYVAQKRSSQRQELSDRLVGRLPVIATQTRAELLAWPRVMGWGTRRSDELSEVMSTIRAIPITDEVVAAYVTLTVDCRQAAHALAQKVHTGDRWIAATAIALDRPLMSLDGIFAGAPRLATL